MVEVKSLDTYANKNLAQSMVCKLESWGFVNNFEGSDTKCAAAIADQQTKPIFDAPFKPKQ